MSESPSSTVFDSFGRRHNSLRISVTDRCNIRCTYCMPENVEFQPQSQLLSFEEITRFVEIIAPIGFDKLRLTGGEPLMRRELPKLVAMLANVPGIRDIGLTTNGVMLAKQAKALRDAGLRRINISLDTLDPVQFQKITRRDSFAQVMKGIDAADSVGFESIKINAVAARGVTDVLGLARFCRQRGFELRFIEFMPLEADHIWSRGSVLTADEILALLADAGIPAEPLAKDDPSAPAEEYRYIDGIGRLGLIASVSKPFCGNCNRVRITADGKLRNCLFSLDEVDIKTPLRSGESTSTIQHLVRECVAKKWAGHQINSVHFIRPERTMHSIGG
jgi:cyclic pyranopterin phosphate synthase